MIKKILGLVIIINVISLFALADGTADKNPVTESKIFKVTRDIVIKPGMSFTKISTMSGKDDFYLESLKGSDTTPEQLIADIAKEQGLTIEKTVDMMKQYQINCFFLAPALNVEQRAEKGAKFSLAKQEYHNFGPTDNIIDGSDITPEETAAYLSHFKPDELLAYKEMLRKSGFETNDKEISVWNTRMVLTIKSEKTKKEYLVSCMSLRIPENKDYFMKAFNENSYLKLDRSPIDL